MHMRSRLTKTWQKPDQPIKRAMNTQRGTNVTVYGAICNYSPEILYMLGESTNQYDFEAFLLKIKAFHESQYLSQPLCSSM